MYFQYPRYKLVCIKELKILQSYMCIKKVLKLENFIAYSYHFFKTVFIYYTYRIQTKSAIEMKVL